MSVYDLNLRQVIAFMEEQRGKRPLAQSNAVLSPLAKEAIRYRQKTLKTFTVSLASLVTDANAALVNVQGTFLQYVASTNPTDLVRVRFGKDDSNDFIPWQPGQGLLGFPFDGLKISVPAAIANATATFLYAQVEPDEVIRFL